MPAKKKTTDVEEKKAKKATKVAKVAKVAKTPAKKVDEVVAPMPGEAKKTIIEEFATKKGDTGSPEVQIALLTKRIDKLVGHLKGNPQDNHSRRGLLGMVSKRRRIINYLSQKDETRAKEVLTKLKLH